MRDVARHQDRSRRHCRILPRLSREPARYADAAVDRSFCRCIARRTARLRLEVAAAQRAARRRPVLRDRPGRHGSAARSWQRVRWAPTLSAVISLPNDASSQSVTVRRPCTRRCAPRAGRRCRRRYLRPRRTGGALQTAVEMAAPGGTVVMFTPFSPEVPRDDRLAAVLFWRLARRGELFVRTRRYARLAGDDRARHRDRRKSRRDARFARRSSARLS